MKKISYILLVLVAASLSACAPAYYEASYYDYYEPSERVSAHESNIYVARDYRPVLDHHYGSIEVTLIADRSIVGINFHPISLVIHDGDFVEVPIRSKRGVPKRVYAHYLRGDLHFDSGRHCAAIQGSSRFRYDRRWDRGHRYDHINAGPDFDLRGVGLIVRKHESNKSKHAVKNTSIQKNANKRYDPVPRKATSKSKTPERKVHAVDSGARERHLGSRSAVSAGIEKEKAAKRQVVERERVVRKTLRSKDSKETAGNVKRGNNQIAERSNVVHSNNRYQGSDEIPTSKAESTKTLKTKKQRKNKYVSAKGKGNDEGDIVENRKSIRGAGRVNAEGLVAMSEDERAVLVEKHAKKFAGSRAQRNK